ncbi:MULTISPECIES: hypothetical protein [Alteromonas]|mgnify:FL=1|jgi:hypothetical protein|uniref:Uncharacterized protein n=1 Tax=Alteromonas mediterranea TaxID=314275 RepID=A0AAC8XPD5_9ALTE|nr:hypothetical protein [Alteromonas mediterranea]AFV87772.1 hypothetical protein amad1_21693 [Alteromonas mediterranea DE1]AGP87814.1 hypothetical protein I607_20417 [Alteromonas mediterranea U4]AGP99795.1 hypothetical protein I635_21704 [Alteromonas mediterranea UM7]AMJ80892.1 hypothetical protein AV942_21170 [Alteromonas mediterranea]AMJ85054.1 hypothetical protein AV941_21285 [Alteromonas mediterranea]|tara:strand:+ start:49642 stop:50484 length:843 start_codon:yes stop_codon:yes gene_type:complete
MTTDTDTKTKPTRKLLKIERLEPYLKFPSGLSLKQAKQNAKALKKEQGINQSEAMKIICWGNGIIDVRDFSQAIPKLIKHTFGLEHEQFGVFGTEDELQGFWYEDNGEIRAISVSRGWQSNTPEFLTDELANHLLSLKEEKLKEQRFLAAVKDCINSIGHKFYRTLNDIPLDDVTDKHHIRIDVDKLLFGAGGGSGQAVMEYVLASCYNTTDTASSIMQKALEIKFKRDEEKHFDISDEYDRQRLSDYVSRHRNFGSICSTLDDHNKDIVKRLIDNYHGW